MSTARVARNAVQSPLLHALTLARTGPSFRYAAYSRKNCSKTSPRIAAFIGLQTIGRLSNSSRMSTYKALEQGKTSINGHETNPTRQNTKLPSLTENDTKKISVDRTTRDSKIDTTEGTSTTGLDEKGIDDEKEVKKHESKLTLMQKVKKEAQHYWDGTKLLATEVKISTKLAVKMAAGYELSRRENRQLQRTVQDIVRLVPFSVFILVPFAELLLPVALKLFPNMLPSTYEGQKSKDTKATTLRATRKEVSNFLRDTLKESGLPLSPATTQRDEFTQFFRKLRATGESPSPTEVINVCKIFKDDLTLDNLSRPQLVGMCRYMNLNTFGTDMMLRYQIRHRMRQIKRDDRAISFEGVDSLSIPELQVACMSRGLRTHGASPGRLRDDLQSWLDLRLQHGVPSTLLVLSNAFVYAQGKSDSEFHSQIDALTGVLSSIPEELFHEMELEIHSAEGAATNKQRLEVLKEQQDLIEEENEQDEENKETGRASPRDDEDIDEKEEKRIIAEAADQQKAQNTVGGELTPEKVDQRSENK
ncbi:MRS7 family protein [Blumeria hordei DH14]|uniref:MRS7 family protein n=1 Tax=Blumeria graminis f. sp. hordei (strain DH14) TaxID=546991 RepID=N1JAW2_BLUG1|nr:MRS7 family protein [Blumeria hordei DH14]